MQSIFIWHEMSDKVTKMEMYVSEMDAVSVMTQEVKANNEATDGMHAVSEKKLIHGQC